MAAANSTRAGGIQIEDYSWGRIVKGTREVLIQHGYTLDGPFPGDPGARKTVERRTDPAGRAIAIQRKSKYIFCIRRDWNEDEAKAYRANMAKKNDSAPQSNPGLSGKAAEFLELFYSRPPAEQAAFLAKHDAGPKRQLIALDFHEYGIERKLIELLDMAKKGEINGLIFSARMTRKGGEPYLHGCEGRLLDNRAEAIGAAVLLQNKLAQA